MATGVQVLFLSLRGESAAEGKYHRKVLSPLCLEKVISEVSSGGKRTRLDTLSWTKSLGGCCYELWDLAN